MNHLSSVSRKISHIIQSVLGQIVVHMYSAVYQKINKDRLYLSFWYTLFPQYFSQVQIKCCIWDIFHILKSLYQSTSLSVSEFVCVFVCLFPNSSETVNPSELKFWGMILLGIGKVFSWKKACILGPHPTLAVNFISPV